MEQRSPFDSLVEDYERGRPDYPDELFQVLARLGGSLEGARVVEVGAGTGIATLHLLAAGAHVMAVDLSEPMLRQLRHKQSSAWAVVSDGHQLPARSGWADLVCYAQTWHWMRPAAALREAVRALRPGGALALWWNDGDNREDPWWQEQQANLIRLAPEHRTDYRAGNFSAQLQDSGLFTRVLTAECAWSRQLSVDQYLSWLRSKSYVARLGPLLPSFLEDERRALEGYFPSGSVTERFRTRVWWANTPS